MLTSLTYKWALAGFLVLALFGGLVSWTVATAASQTITMCARENGLVYMIGDGFSRADCRRNDQLFAWNIGGTPGAQGPQGLQGTQGIQGPTGPMGPQGQAGVAGNDGSQGLQGTAGSVGPQGPIGPTGPRGLAGTASINMYQGPFFFNQLLTSGVAKSWRWEVPAGTYFIIGRVNYRIRSSSDGASSIDCRLLEGGDFGEGQISQDQYTGTGSQRGVSNKGTMTFTGSIFNVPEGSPVGIECTGTYYGDGSVLVDLAKVQLVPVTSVLSIPQVTP